jgi:hypothetical protein
MYMSSSAAGVRGVSADIRDIKSKHVAEPGHAANPGKKRRKNNTGHTDQLVLPNVGVAGV